MTQPEALQEARRRWGNRAEVKTIDPRTFRDSIPNFWVVADISKPSGIVGAGDSWEAAFADAEQNEATK